jgi:cytochrome oxidase assembly protein ShyY1
VKRAIEIVWIINRILIERGWFIKEKEKEEMIKKKNIKFCIISDQKIVYKKY